MNLWRQTRTLFVCLFVCLCVWTVTVPNVFLDNLESLDFLLLLLVWTNVYVLVDIFTRSSWVKMKRCNTRSFLKVCCVLLFTEELKNSPDSPRLSEHAATAASAGQVSLQTSDFCGGRRGRPLPPTEAQAGTGNQLRADRWSRRLSTPEKQLQKYKESIVWNHLNNTPSST